ncbi:MAG: hypothetical protein J6N21_19545 [Butyrivibrio sp.]|nr:hypothetical protein [Butyrivibrio sp.]MBP3199176.1 hypothetical protein [Butyrivibrio sp.]
MIIKQLKYDEYKGRQYKAEVRSDKYLSIEPEGEGFSIEWVVADKEIEEPLEDDMLSDWLDNPVAFGTDLLWNINQKYSSWKMGNKI